MSVLIRLLVADADASVRSILRVAAKEEGWVCDEAADGLSAVKLFRRNEYHIAILEAELPELDGKLTCRQLRKVSTIPIILLSKKEAESDRLAGFAAGGNDYVIKPFYPRELVARVKSFLSLHSNGPQTPQVMEVSGIVLDLQARQVKVDEKPVSLTPKEYDLLLFFMRNPSNVYSRDTLLDLVWGEEFFGTDRTVDTHVKSLRGKIRPHQNTIVTVWGVGYKFEP